MGRYGGRDSYKSGARDMALDAYQVQIIRGGQSKFSKNPIGGKPHTFETEAEAQAFADDLKRSQSDKSNFEKGKATYKVVKI